MRVCLVTETYFPQVNGVSRTLGKLVDHFRDRGDSVLLIHPDYGQTRTVADDFTIPVRSISMPFYRELRLPIPPFGEAHRAIREFRPDLIHIATEATLGLSMLSWARKRRIPTVTSFHTNFDQYSRHYGVGWLRGIIWRYLRWFHNRASETYVPSLATIEELTSRGFERLVLWPRGVDGRLFRPDRPGRDATRKSLGFDPEHVVVGYVSRLAAEKNIDYLVESLALAASMRPEARFLFVGDGPERVELERRMGPHARFVGYRSGEDLADHYAAADLFAFSSLTETFGNVILEAMASGLPVVALRAGGVGEIVRPAETGLLLDPGATPGAFAEAVLRLVDDDRLRRRLSIAAREYAISQSWAEIMEGLRDHYREVIDANRPAAELASLA